MLDATVNSRRASSSSTHESFQPAHYQHPHIFEHRQALAERRLPLQANCKKGELSLQNPRMDKTEGLLASLLRWSSCSRSAEGALTIMALSVCMAWLPAFTAVSRATLRWRIISTALVPDFGNAQAWPARTLRAALSASSASSLPFGWRSWRLGRLTSNTG